MPVLWMPKWISVLFSPKAIAPISPIWLAPISKLLSVVLAAKALIPSSLILLQSKLSSCTVLFLEKEIAVKFPN